MKTEFYRSLSGLYFHVESSRDLRLMARIYSVSILRMSVRLNLVINQLNAQILVL